MKKLSRRKKILLVTLIILLIGYLLPQNFQMPVCGATNGSYNEKSFWYYPWGKSGTHKGVDIFAQKGTPIKPTTSGLVVYAGTLSRGGNVVAVLGPKWRIHYYAHLDTVLVSAMSFVTHGTTIGTVGNTGNAQGKPPHLHYSIATPIPYVWRIDGDHQGWKKMFYIDPTPLLKDCGN